MDEKNKKQLYYESYTKKEPKSNNPNSANFILMAISDWT
jgi:hypothetical protein